jgi:nucleoside-diphosphate-sugar epimerase
MTTVLVTGAGGFIGRHLVNLFNNRDIKVISLVSYNSRYSADKYSTISNINSFNKSNVYEVPVDILDQQAIDKIIAEHRPCEIYHLAGQSSPRLSWLKPDETMNINYTGTVNVLESVLRAKLDTAIVLASSSAIYAPSSVGIKINEGDECLPTNPYGVSKLSVDRLAFLYAKAYGIRVFSARPFFLIGTMKSGDVCSDWARNIVEIERGNTRTLAIGEINGVVRDFLPIEDGLEAFLKIVENGVSGESYNICSSVGYPLSEILRMLVTKSSNHIEVSVDQLKFRPIDELIKIGDNQKLMSLGWRQQHDIDTSLQKILDFWRNQNDQSNC